PVTFTATGTAGTATRLALTTPPSSTAQSGAPLQQQPVVQLQDANGNPVSQIGVVVTATPSPAGAAASNNTATTGSNGAATFRDLTLTGTAGSYTLSFSGGTGITPISSAAIALSAGAVSASQSTVAAAPTSIPAGSGTSTITVTARDAGGNPIGGASGNLTATGGTGITPTRPATVAVRAGAVSASQSTVAAAPTSIPAGSGRSTITVTARDAGGNPIGGASVNLTATGGTGNTLTPATGTTDPTGVMTATFSSTSSGAKTISATINTVAITQTAPVTVTAGAARQI